MKAVSVRASAARATVGLVAVVSLLGLTACQSKVGAAAYVGDQRISERSVQSWLSGSKAGAANAVSVVVQFSVLERLFERVLMRRGGVPSAAELAGLHDVAIGQLLNSPSGSLGTGEAADKNLETVLDRLAIKRSFRATLLRAVELESATIKLSKAASVAELAKYVNQAGVKVSVSPRYGSWNRDQLGLQTASGADFLAPVSPAPSAAAGAAN